MLALRQLRIFMNDLKASHVWPLWNDISTYALTIGKARIMTRILYWFYCCSSRLFNYLMALGWLNQCIGHPGKLRFYFSDLFLFSSLLHASSSLIQHDIALGMGYLKYEQAGKKILDRSPSTEKKLFFYIIIICPGRYQKTDTLPIIVYY